MEQLYCHVMPTVAMKWKEFGNYLGIDAHVIRAVHADQGSDLDHCMAILSRWIDGAGKQPKTWTTVLEAMRCSGFVESAKELDRKINCNTLMHPPVTSV